MAATSASGRQGPGYKLHISGGSAALLNNSSSHMLADAETNNLLFNGDFEQGQEGWKIGSTTLTSVTGGYSGNYALEFTGATATFLNDDYIPVDPTKDVFELEGWLKKPQLVLLLPAFYILVILHIMQAK